jgi:prepilin-type N-terminal cleavage/methylation domain-containing protein
MGYPFIQPRPLKPRGRRRGFTIIELLLAAAITAMLLTVAAVAFQASFASYKDNYERAALLSTGRQLMFEMVEEIKAASSHEAVADTLADQPGVDADFAKGVKTETPGFRILKKYPDMWDRDITPPTADDPTHGSDTWVTRTYKFDAASKQILMVRQVGTQPEEASVAVAKFIDDFKIIMEPTRSQQQIDYGRKNCDILFRATIHMTLKNLQDDGTRIDTNGNGKAILRLTDAAMPRKTFSTL